MTANGPAQPRHFWEFTLGLEIGDHEQPRIPELTSLLNLHGYDPYVAIADGNRRVLTLRSTEFHPFDAFAQTYGVARLILSVMMEYTVITDAYGHELEAGLYPKNQPGKSFTADIPVLETAFNTYTAKL